MDAKKLNTSNGLKLEGFVNIEVINKKDHITRVYKNTITNCGKQFLLDKCAQQLLCMSADVFGNTLASDYITTKGGGSGTSAVFGRVAHASRDITNVLLNLGQDVTLSGSTTHINVWDQDFKIADKLVGYANNNVVPNNDKKEGAIDYTKGEYVIDPYTTAKRWKYPEGVASGTIDTIAMMPAPCVKRPDGDGVRFMKCIDRVNSQYTNYGHRSTGMLPPGISGYTSNDEILLNFSQDNKERWKFNLTNGEVTEVPDGDPFFVVLQKDSVGYLVDIKKEGNYLYVLRLNYISTYSPNVYVQVYDLSVTPTPKLLTTFSFYASSGSYLCGAKFLTVGDQLYVTVISSPEFNPDSASFDKIFTLSKGSNAYWSSVGTQAKDFSPIGVTVPSGLDINRVCFGNYGTNFAMYVYTPIDNESQSYIGYKCKAYIFTNLTNLDPDAALDCVTGMNPNSLLWSAGTNSGVIQIGFDAYSSRNGIYDADQVYDMFDSVFQINNNSKQVTETLGSDGVFISLNSWWTNVISFVRLQTPIEKGDDDIMYVSYGYKVV